MCLRSLIAICLAAVLALTSQSMAVARGASAATGQIVLCTGSGPVAIYIDAEGAPTTAPHICPDAALNVLVDLALQRVSATALTFSPVDWQARATAQTRPVPQQNALARAPPCLD